MPSGSRQTPCLLDLSLLMFSSWTSNFYYEVFLFPGRTLTRWTTLYGNEGEACVLSPISAGISGLIPGVDLKSATSIFLNDCHLLAAAMKVAVEDGLQARNQASLSQWGVLCILRVTTMQRYYGGFRISRSQTIVDMKQI